MLPKNLQLLNSLSLPRGTHWHYTKPTAMSSSVSVLDIWLTTMNKSSFWSPAQFIHFPPMGSWGRCLSSAAVGLSPSQPALCGGHAACPSTRNNPAFPHDHHHPRKKRKKKDKLMAPFSISLSLAWWEEEETFPFIYLFFLKPSCFSPCFAPESTWSVAALIIFSMFKMCHQAATYSPFPATPTS